MVATAFLVAFSMQSRADGEFKISSPAFEPGQPMPARFSFHGANVSPELRIENVPANAKSLLLVVDDPDAPAGLWTHWLVANIPVTTTVIDEGKTPDGAVVGKNSNGHTRYDGPKPPSGTHRYFFHLYALNHELKVSSGFARSSVLPESKIKLDRPDPEGTLAACRMFGTFAAQP